MFTRTGSYEWCITESGKLKLRAKGLLAEGEHRFLASVFLHAAVQLERMAVQSLPDCPSGVMTRSLVEQCGCLVEGFDPPGAADVVKILRHTHTWEAPILARLRPKYDKQQREYVRLLRGSQAFQKVQAGAGIGVDWLQLRQELAVMLAEFPGVASLWWCLAEDAGVHDAAEDARSRAQQLGSPLTTLGYVL